MRIKDIAILNPVYSGADLENESVSFSPMECLRYDNLRTYTIPFSQAKGKYTYFGNNDVLFAKVTPCFENLNTAIAQNLLNGVGFGSSEINILRLKENVSPRYIFYLVCSKRFIDNGCASMCGVGGLKRISPRAVNTFEFSLPSPEEQEAIATYLDRECEKIGRQIELLERKADAYKRLRRSLINRAFSSNIWKKKRIKDVFNIIGGNGFKEELQGKISGDYPFVKNSDINSKGVYLISAANYVDESEVHSYRFNIVPINSIICSKIGAALKLNHRKLTTQETVIDNNLQALVPYDGYNPKFYYYVLTLVDMSRFDNLGAIPCVNNKLLRNYHIPVPPIEEQREIVAYLDDKCGKIDAIIEKIAAKVKRLKELKRSLINEVVTGKYAINNIK